MARVPSMAWERAHATGAAKKKKEEEESPEALDTAPVKFPWLNIRSGLCPLKGTCMKLDGTGHTKP